MSEATILGFINDNKPSIITDFYKICNTLIVIASILTMSQLLHILVREIHFLI